MWLEDFQDGCHDSHLGYQNGTILAILNLYLLNLYVPLMPPIRSVSIWFTVWGAMSFEEWRPSWIAEWNDFSNSGSTCLPSASHQVSAQSNLQFERRCCLKNFKMVAILAIRTEWFKQFWISTLLWFLLNLTLGNGGKLLEIFKMVAISWISEQNDISKSESLCLYDASHQSDLRFGRRCRLKNFKMVTMAAILDIGTELF